MSGVRHEYSEPTKQCAGGCSLQPLPVARFARRSDYPNRYAPRCRQCTRKKHKEWRKRNPERCKKWNWTSTDRARQRLRKYGITPEQYDALLKAQGHRCAICGTTCPGIVKGRPIDWPVDHNHITGRLRGALCTCCNTAVGLVKEDPAIARKLAEYLEAFL